MKMMNFIILVLHVEDLLGFKSIVIKWHKIQNFQNQMNKRRQRQSRYPYHKSNDFPSLTQAFQ